MLSSSHNLLLPFYSSYLLIFKNLMGLKVKSMHTSLPRGILRQEFGVYPSKSCFYTAYNESINACLAWF